MERSSSELCARDTVCRRAVPGASASASIQNGSARVPAAVAQGAKGRVLRAGYVPPGSGKNCTMSVLVAIDLAVSSLRFLMVSVSAP